VQPLPASRLSRTTSAERVSLSFPCLHYFPTSTDPPNLGKPVSHAFAKELVAGFAAAEVDKLAETKGEDWFDREKAKHQAKKNAERMYDDHYVDGQNADQYDPDQYDRPQYFDNRDW